jgi:hypothetical protein
MSPLGHALLGIGGVHVLACRLHSHSHATLGGVGLSLRRDRLACTFTDSSHMRRLMDGRKW